MPCIGWSVVVSLPLGDNERVTYSDGIWRTDSQRFQIGVQKEKRNGPGSGSNGKVLGFCEGYTAMAMAVCERSAYSKC